MPRSISRREGGAGQGQVHQDLFEYAAPHPRPRTPDPVTTRWPLTPLPWPPFGNHQQPSALQQIPGEIPLDADSLGLGGGEQAQVSPRQKPLHLSPTRPWPSQTLAATSRTGFPRAAGRMLKLLYLPRHSWLVQALTLHQRLSPSACPQSLHRPVPTSRPHPISPGAQEARGSQASSWPSQEQLPEPWGTQPVGWQAWGPTEGVGSADWVNPGVLAQLALPIRRGGQPVADAPRWLGRPLTGVLGPGALCSQLWGGPG